MVAADLPSSLFLSEVRISRFKAAFNPAPIPLQPFNVVIGRNGTGKSTMLEALQWIDTTMRRDAREASDRYHGVHDLVNLRSNVKPLYFELGLTWSRWGGVITSHNYSVKVEDNDETATITEETLESLHPSGAVDARLIWTKSSGERLVGVARKRSHDRSVMMKERDRLALGWLENLDLSSPDPAITFLPEFWRRAVFLRLSPNRLSEGSQAKRKSFEPLLDEEGQTLPALLSELTDPQRATLVASLREILPGIRDVEVSKAEFGRDTRVNYNLLELMPYRGRAGRKQFRIPAWMLSEGTRRLTAILALLVRNPPPTLLCIEEIENGLDPWTVRRVLKHLVEAASEGTQVILTTHSPWVLDDVPLESILLVRRRSGDTSYEHFSSLTEVQDFNPSVPAGTRYTHLEQEE